MAGKAIPTAHADAYEPFYDPAWAKELSGHTRGTKYHQATVDLQAGWKGISNARRLPKLAIGIVHGVIAGINNAASPLPHRVIRKIAEKVLEAGRIANVKIHSRARTTVSRHIREWGERLRAQNLDAMREKDFGSLSEEKLWAMLTADVDFNLSLWMAEVNAFTGVYACYEAFVVRVLKAVTGAQSIRNHKIAETLRREFGTGVEADCWSGPGVELPRLVRDAILHNGRRLTENLRQKYRNQLSVEDGEIVVIPQTTDAAFVYLTRASVVLAERAVQKSEDLE